MTLPWDRLEDEPNDWYSRFELFRLAGPTRKLIDVWRSEGDTEGKEIPHRWYTVAGKWHWTERAEAWDEENRQRMRDAVNEQLEEFRANWIQREARVAGELMDKAVQMLKFPLADVRRVNEDTGEVTVIMPTKWTMSDAAKYVLTASKIGRLAVGLKTDSQQVDVVSDKEIQDQLDKELARRIRLTTDPTAEGEPDDDPDYELDAK